ncbi:biotin--[acetyl-CoA-carboxylase] ligase [Psychrobacter sp. UBA3962]|uniref:biotin--[acetyl-CoA-carboxylase] ligase n=1 Tax=Psychrobacter sp. UBA3962 TaxID=1947352 RepID=UPI0025E2E864|nr:ligase [Psychrobacter sp. UBA3962]
MYSYTPQTSQPIPHKHLAVCGSTNNELMQSLAQQEIDSSQPYLLTASQQTAGRGQRARTWQSPIGNIYLSLYHPLSVPISGLLSLVVGFHLTRLPIIQQINRQRHAANLPPIGVKWANDIGYYATNHTIEKNSEGNSFRKLAGILIEPVAVDNKITGVVVGVGINIEAAPVLGDATQESMGYQAVSLTQIIDETAQAQMTLNAKNEKAQNQTAHNQAGPSTLDLPYPKADDLYLPVSTTILRAIHQFTSFKHQAYSLPSFIEDYQSVNVLAGRQVQITQQPLKDINQSDLETAKPVVLQGEVMGLNEDGSLQLKTDLEDKIVKIYTGTIRII